ncbi:MAG: hypothetical protein ACREE9_06185 [Stellaceae bacterium]
METVRNYVNASYSQTGVGTGLTPFSGSGSNGALPASFIRKKFWQPCRAARLGNDPGLSGAVSRVAGPAQHNPSARHPDHDDHQHGDLNPYAVVVAPATVGKIRQGDVLVDNFNNISNLQGTGTTIIRYRPADKTSALFAKLPQNLAQCPGGVGLSTAMTVLKSGWVIVGSTPAPMGPPAPRAMAA